MYIYLYNYVGMYFLQYFKNVLFQYMIGKETKVSFIQAKSLKDFTFYCIVPYLAVAIEIVFTLLPLYAYSPLCSNLLGL